MKTLNFKFLTIYLTTFLVIISCKMGSDNNKKSKADSNASGNELFMTNTTLTDKDTELHPITDVNVEDQNATEMFENYIAKYDTDVKTIIIKNEMIKLFDPETHPCPLPLKLKEAINKLKKDKKPWYPKYIDNYLISIQKKDAKYFPSSSVSQLFHEIIFKNGTTEKKWLVSKSPTYDNFVIDLYYLKGKGSFFYSLDCSGYFNAALNAAVSLPAIADLKAKAESALESSNSLFIAGATVVNPIFAAYFNNLNMDNKLRISILKELVTVTGTSDDDIILIIPGFTALWTSNTGTSSFNGKGELASNASYAIGSGSASNSGTISRKSSYQNYNTYIVSFGLPFEQTEPITVGKVKALINKLSE